MNFTFQYSTRTENGLTHTVSAESQKEALEEFYKAVGEDVYFVELKEKNGVSDARARAVKKYQTANIVRVNVVVNKKTEPELYDFIFSLENKSGFIKSLILDEMKRQGR